MVAGALQVHGAWLAARRPTELHVYERGGHGFGMTSTGQVVNSWPERWWEWLAAHGFFDTPS